MRRKALASSAAFNSWHQKKLWQNIEKEELSLMLHRKLRTHYARQGPRQLSGSPEIDPVLHSSTGALSFLSIRKCLGALCLLILVPPSLLSTGTGAGQRPAGKPGTSTTKDEKYYDRLLDSTFYDVARVMELGMDFALTYQAKVEQEFTEWVTGRSLKTPEQQDYFQAMETLHQGWDLLLKAATVYHESRERQTNDATTERLREEAHRIYQQGVEKVRTAESLRRTADEKRSARRRAQAEQLDREKEAANQRKVDEVKSTAADFEELNAEEAKEEDLHNLNIANIESTAAGNPKRRQTLLANEDRRHERRVGDFDKRRDELGHRMLGGSANGTQSRESPDYKSADDAYPRSDTTALKDADECFPLTAKAYEGCGATLPAERTRWESEAAQNKREIARENARHSRRLSAMSKGSPGSNPRQETECHERNARQLAEASNELQDRHRRCFAN